MINLQRKLSEFYDLRHKTRNKCGRGITISCLGILLLKLTTKQSEKATNVRNKVNPVSTDHCIYSTALIVSI